MAYNITFSPDGWADYLYWQTEDKKTKPADLFFIEGENVVVISCRGHYED